MIVCAVPALVFGQSPSSGQVSTSIRYRRSESAPQLYWTWPHTPSPQYRSMVPLNPAGQGFCAVVSDGVSGQSLSGRHCLRTARETDGEKAYRSSYR